MHHPAQRIVLLEMIEPPFPLGSIHHCTLMRTVDTGHPLFKYHFLFVRSVDILRAEDGLPARLHSTFWNAHVIIAIALVNLGTFGHRTGINCSSLIKQLGTIRTHPMNNDRASPVNASSQICLPVLIPERTRVFPLGNLCHMRQRCPRAFGILSIRHEQSLMWCTEENPELTVMITDGRCPRATGIAGIVIPPRKIETVVQLRYQPPVHHILRLQYLHTEEMEIGSHHVVAVAHTYHIRVGVIGIQDRIDVGAVALVAPCLQRLLSTYACRNCDEQKEEHCVSHTIDID